jgi:hypothetical protein
MSADCGGAIFLPDGAIARGDLSQSARRLLID